MYRSVPAVLMTAVCCSTMVAGQPVEGTEAGAADVMRQAETLWPEGVPGALGATEADRPEVTLYLPPAGQGSGAGLVVCPGGGYAALMLSYEGHDIARWLNRHGVAALVLRYRVKPYAIADAVADGKRAMRLLRSRAREWGLDAARLGMIGFSAGGHLAMSVATADGAGDAAAPDPIERVSCRPDFLVLVYPSTTLGGGTPTSERVTKDTPPAFIVHAATDKVVPVAESDRFHAALRQQGISSEFLRLPTGEHGLGCGEGELWAQWQAAAVAWLAGPELARQRLPEQGQSAAAQRPESAGPHLRLPRPESADTAVGASPAHVTPNAFQGSDVERINQAIRAAAGTGRRVVIPRRNLAQEGERDVWRLDSAILVPGDTVLELDHCHIKLADGCRDNLIRSANCGLGITDITPLRQIHIYGVGTVCLEGADRPRATGDSGKTLGKPTFGTDAGRANESQTGDWRNIGILLAQVEDFSLRNLRIKDSHGWAISLERCARGTLRDLDFASTQTKLIDGTTQTILNQDGVDLRLGCHDLLIENITGYSGDDLVALTAIPQPNSVAGTTGTTLVSGGKPRGQGQDDIRQVIIRNVRGHCRGGHHLVRLLNTPGLRLYDVLVDGVIDTSPPGLRCKATVKIGDTGYGGGSAALGDTCRITVNGITSRAQHAVLIGGSLCDSIISNVLHQGASEQAVSVVAGPDHVRNVLITNVVTTAPMDTR